MTKPRRISRFATLEGLLRTFSPGERFLLYGLTIVLGLSAFALLAGANASVSVTIPSHGGSLTEGEVGPARFLNPVIAMSQADADLSALVYSGLTRALPDGTITPDLAQSFDISADGTTYTFKLRPTATFHDGTPLTSADVAFTVAAAQNPNIKSPLRADWEGVVVQTPDSHTVIFKLPHAYAPFIQNTTMGILPKHLWSTVSAEEFPFSPVNTHPVGSGPYKVSGVQTDSTGSVTRYDLIPFKAFALGEPYIGRITFLFYPNQDGMLAAFNQGRIDAVAGIDPEQLSLIKRTDTQTVSTILPRVFGVFFNQSHSAVLSDASVRAALDTAIDKQRLVDMTLFGYGVPLKGPLPPIAAPTDNHTINVSTAYTTVIRPRNYDAILFGEVVGRELDLFAFWHSSQRNDPGLNLALYANAGVDTLLSQARATTDTEERTKIYDQFATLLEHDRPAVFLYSPEFLYEVPKSLKGVSLGATTVPSERFLNVYQWYTDTESVWSIFTDKSPETGA